MPKKLKASKFLQFLSSPWKGLVLFLALFSVTLPLYQNCSPAKFSTALSVESPKGPTGSGGPNSCGNRSHGDTWWEDDPQTEPKLCPDNSTITLRYQKEYKCNNGAITETGQRVADPNNPTCPSVCVNQTAPWWAVNGTVNNYEDCGSGRVLTHVYERELEYICQNNQSVETGNSRRGQRISGVQSCSQSGIPCGNRPNGQPRQEGEVWEEDVDDVVVPLACAMGATGEIKVTCDQYLEFKCLNGYKELTDRPVVTKQCQQTQNTCTTSPANCSTESGPRQHGEVWSNRIAPDFAETGLCPNGGDLTITYARLRSYDCSNGIVTAGQVLKGDELSRSGQCGPRPCPVQNGSGAQAWNSQSNSWGGCSVDTCNSGYEEHQGVCILKCASTQERINGVCVNKCTDSQERINGVCVNKCTDAQERINGICVNKCAPNDERINGICVAKCGVNEVRNSQGYCVPNMVCTPGSTQSCSIPNGTGITTCNSSGSGWGSCVPQSCHQGYQLQNGQCVPVVTEVDPFCTGTQKIPVVSGTCGSQVWTSCAAAKTGGCSQNGLYSVKFDSTAATQKVYCDMQTAGGGWTVITNNCNGDQEPTGCIPAVGSTDALACGSTDGYDRDFNVRTKGLQFKELVWAAYGTDFSNIQTYRYFKWNNTQGFPESKYWRLTPNVHDAKLTGYTSAPLIACNWFGTNRLTAIENAKPYNLNQLYAGRDVMTVFDEDDRSSNPGRMSFTDTRFWGNATGSSDKGLDDFQDNWGCGDKWAPKTYRGASSYIMAR